jgi:hypothetical protein
MNRASKKRLVTLLSGLGLAATLLPVTASAQTYTWRNVEIVGGGYVPGIVFNPTEPDLIYARTDIGGAYRWNPATGRWVPLLDWIGFDDWNLTGVGSIATDPVDPDRVYLLVGTYTNEWTSQNGAVLRSTNRGATWQRTNLPFKVGGNMPARNTGERLAIDPNQNGILYLGARSGNGLWRSADFGASWSRVTNFPDTGPFAPDPNDPNHYLSDPVGVLWVTFDGATGTPGSPTQTIYVGVAQNGSGRPNVFRSTNAGATWEAIPGQPTCSQSGTIVTCTGGATWDRTRVGDGGGLDWNTPGYIPHHGLVASNRTLYVTYNNWEGPYNGNVGDVWKFAPQTGSWTKISPVPGSDSSIYFGYGGLAVDASNPDVVMVAALNSWWPDTILFRSLNGGATWTRIWDWAGYPQRTLRYVQDISAAPWLVFTDFNPVPPVPSPKLGWMVGDLEIDPHNPDRLMYGTGATIYGCEDLTAWDSGGPIHIEVMAQGIEETAVLDLISPPSGASLLSALGDIAGFRHDSLTTPPARMFAQPNLGTNTSLDYAESTPNFVVRAGNVGVGFSYDGGANWFQGNVPGGVNGGGTVAAAANASRVVWSPQGTGVHVSTNNGSSWTPSSGIPAGAIVESDRVNPMRFYGYAAGRFYASADGGVTFTASPATGLPPVDTHVRFKAVPGREGDVWLAGGSGTTYGLWHSTNGGASFTKLANVEEADSIGFGRPAPGQTYPALFTSAQIGGVRGIFRSDDTGASWVRINDDAHQYGSTNAAITGDARVYGRVYVSTNGRGIVWGEPTVVNDPDFSLSAAAPSVTVNRGGSAGSSITITRLNGFASSVSFSASGLPTGVTATFNPSSTTGTNSTLTFNASSTAPLGAANVTITGSGGGLSRTVPISLTVTAPDFSLSASPASVSVSRGGSAGSTITITRTGGFSASVSLSASGLPSGVTATVNPASTTGTSATVTFNASSTAALGTTTVTITGSGGGLTRSVPIALTVSAPDFSLSSSPPTVTVSPGSSASTTVSIGRTGGFSSSVSLAASGLPSGVTANFNPASTTGGSSTLTFTAAAGAPSAQATVTVTGTGGGLTRTVPVNLTVSAGDGGVTVTAVVTTSSPWFNEQQVRLSNTGALTALSITVVIQRTTGVGFNGQYNTVGSQITQSNTVTSTTLTYQ